MLVRLFACLAIRLLVVFGQSLSWEAAFNKEQDEEPEARSFASMAGLPNSSTLIMYGGYSHARGTWLHEVWSLRTNDSNPTWRRLQLQPGTEPVPVVFPTLVSLGGSLLLVGGCYEDKTTRATDRSVNNYSRHIFKLDLRGPRWTKVTVNGMPGADLPRMYRHAAVTYTVNGSERVLITGGDAETFRADTYELSYNADGGYSLVTLSSSGLPAGLIGHILVAAGESVAYLIGGVEDFFYRARVAALPGKLVSGMQSLDFDGKPNLKVYRFSRGMYWDRVTDVSLPSAYVYPTSYRLGSRLYLYGGFRSEGPGITSYDPLVLDVTSGSIALIPNAGREANATWGAVQPGAVAGAAGWVDTSGPDQGKPVVWLFGGVTAPWPLPAAADTYFSPQDSSLTWRLVLNASAGAGSHGAWLAPLPGAMAPRSGAMVVPVTVDGQQKLLSLGGRSLAGWTASPKFHYSSHTAEGLTLVNYPESSNTTRAVLRSYQLYDIWLFDVASGVAEPVWCINSTTVGPAARCAGVPGSWSGGGGGGGGCASLPFGNAASGAWLGWLWDRRLLPYTVSGDSNSAFYMHAEVSPTTDNVTASIWRLSLSTTTLTTAAAGSGGGGSFQTYVATWQLLSRSPLPTQATCYPRMMHGVAHLTSMSNANVSYIVMHGGLVMYNKSNATVFVKAVQGRTQTCLLEISPEGARWLLTPDTSFEEPKPVFSSAAALFRRTPFRQPRYRHACAPHPGLRDFAVTCLGGLSSPGNKPLWDVWTLTVQPGVTMQSEFPVFSGKWEVAAQNATVVWPNNSVVARPTQLVNFLLTPVQGSSPAWQSTVFSPLLLLYNQPDKAGAWLLDAISCPETAAEPSLNIERRMQLWQAILPNGTLAQVASSLGLPAEWRPASVVGVLGSQPPKTNVAVWLVLGPADGNATDLRFAKMVLSPPSQGCLSLVTNLSCTAPSAYDKSLYCIKDGTQSKIEVTSRGSNRQPQFVIIAICTAAGGAILLVFCLWHCVFRPVQLRRQAAAAMAAAANNSASTGGRVPAHCTQVPAQYLHLMEISTYSANSALRAVAEANKNAVADNSGCPAGPEGVDAAAADASMTAPVSATAAGADNKGGKLSLVTVEPTASKVAPCTAGGCRLGGQAITSSEEDGGCAVVDGTIQNTSSSTAAASLPDRPAKLGGSSSEVCAICLCDFEEGERIKHLPCKHFYHVPCIDQWLDRDITCPLCKDNVLEAMHTLFGSLPQTTDTHQASGPIGSGGSAAAVAAAAPATTDTTPLPPVVAV